MIASDNYPDLESIQKLVRKLNEQPKIARKLARSLREDFVRTVTTLFKLDEEMVATAREIARQPYHPVSLWITMLELLPIPNSALNFISYERLPSQANRAKCKGSISIRANCNPNDPDDCEVEVGGTVEF
ncbi:hypothetical protein C7B61_00255 [filamentous cyanobacterium CCP1]|nr:hypothetical protein C7B76_16805 [filamentous cyanobacterium CCP2]PSB68531.1 hypothetical protein C7B61_00255 [filamentous cyanobacterium CCP1]